MLLAQLHELASLSLLKQPTVADVQRACALIAEALGAEDAYVIRAGDPHFVRMGCDCAPDTYEIKQKGYWLIWRAAVENPGVSAGLFDVRERIVDGARPLLAGRAASHVGSMLPGDESNAELLLVRGPWESGLSEEQVRFVEIARPALAQLVSGVLDAHRQVRQREQLESFANVAKAFSEARETDNVLQAVATALAKASGFDWAIVSLYDDEGRQIVDRAMNMARHYETETAEMFRDGRSIARIASGGQAAGEVAAQGAQQEGAVMGARLQRHGPVLLADVFDASRDDEPTSAAIRPYLAGLRKYWERAHIISLAVFPIVFRERVIGDVSFSASRRHDLDAAEVEFLQALASQAAMTLQGVRLYRDLERSREELRRSEERFRSLVQNASDLVTVVSADTTVSYQSPSIGRVLGYGPEEITGARLAEFLHGDDVSRVLAALHGAMAQERGTAVAEARMRHRDGSWRHMELIGTNQFNNPAIGGFVLNVRDVTERTELERQLRHQALHDPLTKLANRTRFADRLEHALLRARRSERSIAVLFMDLDNFKAINDTLGHAAGDALLTEVAERVQSCLRPGDTVARLGGDEFAVLIEDVTSPDDGAVVADRIFEMLEAPFVIETKELSVRASIGIAMSDREGACDADSLLRDADVAMYVAKSQGKGQYRIFEQTMQRALVERMELLADLQQAIEHEQFVLHYQPMVLLESGRLFGVEALVRWQHPARGLMAPADFIPLAEESGAIVALGRWVLREACAQAAEWRRQYPVQADWTISVNVSVKQIQDPGFAADVRRTLEETVLEPRRLILEITESVMMHDVPAMMQRLSDLKALGVRLAIDDFGTGYSSLSYLRQFPFDLLKIDKSFIDDVGAVPVQRELANAIIELGKTLDLELVAEGIEQREQLARLQQMRCELGQGFYFSEPVDAEGVRDLLAGLEREAA